MQTNLVSNQIPTAKPLTMEVDIPQRLRNPAQVDNLRTMTIPTKIELSADGMRHLEISRAFSHELIDIYESHGSSGSFVQDLTIAFGRIYQQFPPAGNNPISAESRFVAGETFTRGEVIFYDNRHWEILQDFTHNGDDNWRPGLAHSLFRETTNEGQTQGYCPILHSAFSGMVRLAFGVEAIQNETMPDRDPYQLRNCENTNILFRNIMLNRPIESEEAWRRSQEQAEIFIETFLQNVYTIGHEAAFNTAMQAIQ